MIMLGMVLQQLYKNELVTVSELVSELVIQLCSYWQLWMVMPVVSRVGEWQRVLYKGGCCCIWKSSKWVCSNSIPILLSLSLSLFLGGPLTSNLVRNILNMPIEIDPHHGGNRGRRDEISWWRSAWLIVDFGISFVIVIMNGLWRW